MRTFDELEALWTAAQPSPVGRGTVRHIGVRKGGGVHESPERVELTLEDGLVGDRWTRDNDPTCDAQLTLMNAVAAEAIVHDAGTIDATGDNFFVDLDLSEAHLPIGSRLSIGGAVIEVTPEPHTGCKRFAARFGAAALRWASVKAHRARCLRGVHCKVITPGAVAVGDPIVVSPPASTSD